VARSDYRPAFAHVNTGDAAAARVDPQLVVTGSTADNLRIWRVPARLANPMVWVGLIQAYLLMTIIAVLLVLGSGQANARKWNVVGALTHCLAQS
jgi:hypothetical protein